MNVIDLLLLIPLCYAAWVGFKKGFVVELFTLLALLVGLYAALNFSEYAESKLSEDFDLEHLYVTPVSFLLTFLAVGAGVYFLGKVIEKMLTITLLSPLNKVAGILFSLVKMAYILSVLLIIFDSFDERNHWVKSDIKQESSLYLPIQELGKKTIPGISTSTIFLQNALKEEKEETGLTVEQILRAKEVADSLGIDASDAKEIYRIHQEYAN